MRNWLLWKLYIVAMQVGSRLHAWGSRGDKRLCDEVEDELRKDVQRWR